MKKQIILLFAMLAAVFTAAAQAPLYIVNGIPREEISSIAPEDIEQSEMLPADEETIARYGQRASNGVILVTLHYDSPARFEAAQSFTDYIAEQVKWSDLEPAARVILRYTVTPEGRTEVSQTLDSTDSRFKRRVLKAISEAPAWTAATKNGQNIASEGVLNLQLPVGKKLQLPVEVVWR